MLIRAVADGEYRLASLKVNGVERKADVNAEGELTVTVEADLSVEVTFESQAVVPPTPEQFTVTYADPTNGTLVIEQDGKVVASGSRVNKGSDLLVKVQASVEYELASLMINGAERKADLVGGVLTVRVEGNVNIAATYAAKVQPTPEPQPTMYTITYSAPTNGELVVEQDGKTLASGSQVKDGSDVVVKVQPDAGYELATLKISGIERKGDLVDGKLTLRVGANVEIVASFVKKQPSAVEHLLASVSLYPNPVHDRLVISGVAQAEEVQLLTLSGVVLRRVAVEGVDALELDVSDLGPGVYAVVAVRGSARRLLRVVKQ